MSWFHSSSSGTVKLAEKLALAERNLEAVVEQLQAVEQGHAEEIGSLQAKIDALSWGKSCS